MLTLVGGMQADDADANMRFFLLIVCWFCASASVRENCIRCM